MKTLLAVTIIKTDSLPHVAASSGTWKTVLAILFSFTGVISLLMMVIAGFRYTTSAGDANETAKARRQILYTAVGLIVSLMAALIVTFVIGNVGP